MKKQFLFLSVMMFVALTVFAQTPYDHFAPEQSAKEMIELPSMQFRVVNADSNSDIRYVEFDKESRSLILLNDNGSVLKTLALDPKDTKFTSIDPHVENYYPMSPYAAMANNPVRYIDPTGMDWIEDKEGTVMWKQEYTKDNVPEGAKYIGTEYTGISIDNYDLTSYPTKDGNYTSLNVDISYRDPNTNKQNNYNWVQTVERDDKTAFVDTYTKEGEGNYPYYQDETENRQSRNKNGVDIKYHDTPDERQSNGYFNAELSLIGDPVGIQKGNVVYNPNLGIQGKNLYSPIATMKYGFSVRNGNATASPIRIVLPTPFQIQTINRIK